MLLLPLLLPGVKSQEMPRLPAVAVELTKDIRAAGQAVPGADLSQVDPTQTVPPEPGSSTPTAAGRAYAPVVFELARTATATRPPATPTIGPTRTVPPPPGSPTPTAVGRAYAPIVFELVRTSTPTVPPMTPTLGPTNTIPAPP